MARKIAMDVKEGAVGPQDSFTRHEGHCTSISDGKYFEKLWVGPEE